MSTDTPNDNHPVTLHPITFQHAHSPLCHLPGDPADPNSRRVAAADTVRNALSLLEMLEQLDTDETKPIWMLACVVCDGLRHALELLDDSRESGI